MEKLNKCIACSVVSCAHHGKDADYCTLNRITVGTHEPHPGMDQCTDCRSFCKK